MSAELDLQYVQSALREHPQDLAQIARLAGVSPGALDAIRSGTSSPTVDELIAVRDACRLVDQPETDGGPCGLQEFLDSLVASLSPEDLARVPSDGAAEHDKYLVAGS